VNTSANLRTEVRALGPVGFERDTSSHEYRSIIADDTDVVLESQSATAWAMSSGPWTKRTNTGVPRQAANFFNCAFW
jgi:hypothetical protein